MTLITPLVYLALVTWAIIQSNRRWMTFLWIIVGLATTLGLFAGAAEIWPDLTEIFGHMALISTPKKWLTQPTLLETRFLANCPTLLENPQPGFRSPLHTEW
jgi:hypothetical protein